jgi:hypothetical protein
MTARKIAVLVRERQSEALRMALGLTLVDDLVDVYVLDRKLEAHEEDLLNLELMKDTGIHIYSNRPDDSSAEYRTAKDIAQRLLEYDHILPY